MKNAPERITLALSGGGGRGAYQLGVWRALEEMGYWASVQAIAGTSIGAINGALMLCQPREAVESLWASITPGRVFQNLPDSQTSLRGSDWLRLGQESLRGGIDITPLYQIIQANLDEAKIRQGERSFGLTAYNRSQRRGANYSLADIPPGLLGDYILASASFPVFRPYPIQGENYLDGGLFDVLPIQLAIDLAPTADLILAVDITASAHWIPRYRQLQRKLGYRLIILHPSRSLPSPARFGEQVFRQQWELGYHDTRALITSTFTT